MTNTDISSRQQQLHEWVQHVFDTENFILESLPGDASSRRYHRIQVTDTIANTVVSYIVMDAIDEQEAMQQFIDVATLMRSAVNVPTIIAKDLNNGFLILQDFGTVEFAHLLIGASPAQVDSHYQLAMQTLIGLQKLEIKAESKRECLPYYDKALLDREMDLFSDWFIPHIGVELNKALWENLKAALVKEILAQPQVVVHRDYHSRNLMQDQTDTASLGVIDFQDAVIGAYSYDLVSLVRDAYVEWPEQQVSRWIQDFWHLQQQAGLATVNSAEQFENDVNVMGVQRHLKVLGIFIRLFERDGKGRYLADIPKVMRDMIFELEWLGAQGSDSMRQAVLPFNEWLIDIVLPAYQRKFVQQYI